MGAPLPGQIDFGWKMRALGHLREGMAAPVVADGAAVEAAGKAGDLSDGSLIGTPSTSHGSSITTHM